MYKIIKSFLYDRGTVMLETVLTLPVYLIMLAGLFWLGELCVARLAFTSGENLRLWEQGLRHPFTPVPERSVFSFLPTLSSTDQLVTGSGNFNFSRTSPPQTGGWGIGIAGTASMLTRRSDWSWAVNQGALNALGSQMNVSQTNLPVRNTTSRLLLNRNVFVGRRLVYNAGTNNGLFWQGEYSARWTVGSATIQPPHFDTPINVSLYNGGIRNVNYNQWSE